MSTNLSLSLRVLVSATVMTIATGCGSAMFKHSSDKKAAQKDATASENLSDCLALGNPDVQVPSQQPTYVPGKEPTPDYGTPVDTGYDNGGKGGGVIVVNPNQPTYQSTQQPTYQPTPTQQPSKGDVIVPTSPCKAPVYNPATPTQTPSQNPDYYQPIDTKGGEPAYPGQQPIVPTDCGKNGYYCDDGKGGQYPTQTISGGSYDRGDLDACLNAFRTSGYDTQGQWGVQVREEKNVSVLSGETFTDQGTDHAIVIIKAVNVLSQIHYQLLNPNALYCIKSVSVLNDTFISSCMTSNVVFGNDVSVLAHANTQLVDCHY